MNTAWPINQFPDNEKQILRDLLRPEHKVIYEIGSWVGNSVEQYTLPVMRIYPKEGFKQVIDDHLNQVWTVEVNLIDEVWNITIESSQEVIIMLPVELIHQKEIIINGSKKSINILEVRDQNYIVKII